MQTVSELKSKDLNQAIPETLAKFHQLSDSQQVRLPVVKGLLSVSSATIWRMVKAQQLKTYKLTERTTTFNVGELRALLHSKGVA